MREDLGRVLSYPFTDTLAYILLAVFVFAFGFAASIAGFGGWVGTVFSQGLLYAYAFTAVNRVSSGNMKGFMPPISDITDLVQPLRVGVAAFLVSSAPFILLLVLFPAVSIMESLRSTAVPPAVEATATPSSLGEENLALLELSEEDLAEIEESMKELQDAVEPPPGAPFWIIPALGLALLWKVVYSPVALIAGAISRSFVATLNPVTGIRAIFHMGSVYWEAMVVYTLLTIVQAILGLVLGWIPVVGQLVMAFVQSYVFLVVGCLLGLAVFKKARELGLE